MLNLSRVIKPWKEYFESKCDRLSSAGCPVKWRWSIAAKLATLCEPPEPMASRG
jgi:hypothetical protein